MSRGTLFIIFLAIGLLSFSLRVVLAEDIVENQDTWQKEFSLEVMESVNSQRIQNGLEKLNDNIHLQVAAQKKAEDMAKKSYFAHTSPDGKSPWFWINQDNIEYIIAGENLAVRFESGEEAVEGWMDSSSHRKNILKREYSETGIGVAKGFYKGKETVFVAQVFIKPKVKFSLIGYLEGYL